MTIQHISLWAVIALLVILSATIGLFSLIDKRLGHRIVRTIGTATLQLSLLCALFMLLFHFDHWWSSLLLLVVLMAAAALFRLLQLHLSWKQWLLPLTLSMLAGSVVPIIILLWALTPDVSFWHPRFVLPVIALMAGHLLISGSNALQTYRGSLLRTKEHREYLLSCGASHIESIIPSVRRALRASVQPSLMQMGSVPLLLTPPMMFCGMILGGMTPITSAAVTLLTFLSFFIASTLSTIILIYLADRIIWPKQ